jgi:hypothetical protein
MKDSWRRWQQLGGEQSTAVVACLPSCREFREVEVDGSDILV